MSMPSTLAAGDLRLRRYRLDHGPFVAAAVRESGRHLARYETWAHPGFDDDEGRRHASWWEQAWEAGTARYYAIWRGDRYLGSVGISGIDLEHKTAGLGYWVRASGIGEGVATAAASAVVEAAFEDEGLQRIEVMTAVGNAASRRVAEKLGAGLEGILRKRQVLDGMAVDCALYSIIR
ncbi:MAG: GNAT family protein [Actinomycetota bacterium]